MQKSATPLSIVAIAVAALALAAGCGGQPQGAGAIPGPLGGALPEPAGDRMPGALSMRAPETAMEKISVTIETLLPGVNSAPVVALGLELDGKPKSFLPVNIGSKSPCVQHHNVQVTCTVTFEAAAGSHWLTVDGYKSKLKGSKPPAQKPISTNGVPVTANRATTSVKLSMYQRMAGVTVDGLNAGITGSVADGFTFDRSAATGRAAFAIFLHDAAGKIIVGPSTAALGLDSSNKHVVLTTPEPNQFALDPSAVATAVKTTIEVVVKKVSCGNKCKFSFGVAITASATPTPSPSPTSSPTPVVSPTPTASPTPAGPTPTPRPTPTPTAMPLVFVSYSTASGGEIRAFSLQGALQTTWALSNSPSTLAFDTNNGFVYAVTNGAATSIAAFDHSGNAQTLTPGFGSLGTVTSITYDSHNNELYVAAGGTVKAYDANGNLELGSAFTSFSSTTPGGMTFDASNRTLYLIDGTSIEQWSEAGVKGGASGFAAPNGCKTAGCVPTALVFNPPGLNWLYAVWSDGTKTAMACYQQSGGNCNFGAGSNAFNTIDLPAQISFNSSNGNVYVPSVDGISVWDLEGNKQTTTGTFPSGSPTAINGIALGQ